MPLDIWFRQDIESTITAAEEANARALGAGLVTIDPALQRAYHQGFRAALSTIALAFGLPPLPLADLDEERTIIEATVSSHPRLRIPSPGSLQLLAPSLAPSGEKQPEDQV